MKEEKLEAINERGIRPHLKLMSTKLYELQESILMDDGGLESLDLITQKIAQMEVLTEELEYFFEVNEDDLIKYRIRSVKNERPR